MAAENGSPEMGVGFFAFAGAGAGFCCAGRYQQKRVGVQSRVCDWRNLGRSRMRDGNESPVRRTFHGYERRLEWHAYRRPGNALLCACLEGERAEMGQKMPLYQIFCFHLFFGRQSI